MTDTAYADEAKLADVLSRYQSAHLDPVVVTETFREIWRVRAERLGRSVEVPPCPYTNDELAALDHAGRRVGYLPQALATQSVRPDLAKVFPAMDDFALLSDNSVTNDVDYAGWFDYEVAIDSPLTGLDETEVLEVLAERGQVLMTLNQYVIASQDSRLLTGRYLDETEPWSRTGSKSDGRLMAARFDGKRPVGYNTTEVHVEGCLCCGYDVSPHDRGPGIGARSTTRWSEVAPPGPVTKHKPVPAPPQIPDLDAEWERIAGIYIRLGYHTMLSMSEDEYRASLPTFAPQPASYRGRFDLPLIVETRLPWEQLAEPAGIKRSSFMHIPYEPVDERHRMQTRPYSGWFTSWGQRFPDGIAPPDALASLADDEVGGNPHELVAMEIAHPQFNETGRYWDAIGYIFPPQVIDGVESHSAFTRYTGNWRPRGVPELAANLNPFPYTFFRPLVRGAAISSAS